MKSASMQRCFAAALLLTLAGAACAGDKATPAAENKAANKSFSAGFDISDSASVKQIGLPIYPGATANRENEKESAAANLSVWAGAFGAKLVVMKLESADAPGKVASFYQDALGKYGAVLDCSKGGPKRESGKKESGDAPVSCDNDSPSRDGQLFKAGSKRMQHIVGVQPWGQGTRFQLVYLEAKIPD